MLFYELVICCFIVYFGVELCVFCGNFIKYVNVMNRICVFLYFSMINEREKLVNGLMLIWFNLVLFDIIGDNEK